MIPVASLSDNQSAPTSIKLLGVLHPLFQCMNRAHGVIHFDVRFAAELFHRLGRRLDVSKIVGRLENAKHVHAVGDGALDEFVDDLIRVGPVGENVLPAQQHLQFRLRHHRFDTPQPLPRIFIEVAHANIERRAAPDLDRIKAAIIDGRAQRQQIVGRDARRELALLPIARRQIGDLYPAAADGFRSSLFISAAS